MATKPEVFDSAIDVLRRGDALSIDAVARDAGLTKPGPADRLGAYAGHTLLRGTWTLWTSRCWPIRSCAAGSPRGGPSA